MLRLWRTPGLRPQPCELKYFLEFAQGVRAHISHLGYLVLRAGRNVQNPERHFQNPAVLIFQAAVGHSPASSYEARMHPYCTAMPCVPRVANFAYIPNMGVALLSCTIAAVHISPWGLAFQTKSSERFRQTTTIKQYSATDGSSRSQYSVVCITSIDGLLPPDLVTNGQMAATTPISILY